MSDMDHRNTERDATLEHLYDMLFQAWPLMRRKLLPSSAQQAEFGMPLSHVQVLVMLDHRGSLSITEISQSFGIAKPNITPLVDRLFEAGYVDRQHDENDRRVVNIVLLPAGMEKLSAIRATISRQIQTQAEDLSLYEFRELHDSLESVVRILSSL